MSAERPANPEKEPSAVLYELGFTPTGTMDGNQKPLTFDIVVGSRDTMAIAYDQNFREWSTVVESPHIEETLVTAGFTKAASPYSLPTKVPRKAA